MCIVLCKDPQALLLSEKSKLQNNLYNMPFMLNPPFISLHTVKATQSKLKTVIIWGGDWDCGWHP